MAKRLGVSPSAISSAIREQSFPARWYMTIKDMCDEAGRDCPTHLFGFIGETQETRTHLSSTDTACSVSARVRQTPGS